MPLTPEVPTSRPTSASGTQGGVDELVRAHGVLLVLRLAQLRPVDAAGDAVDEAPLEDRAPDGADGILGVRIEVEAEPLAVLAVPGTTQLERELEGLHERRRAHHVVVVERAPAAVR